MCRLLQVPSMASDFKGKAIVIMGVSGAGKSTIGEILARDLKCKYLDADDFHSLSNKEKMRQGIPLSDEDRIPWLKSLQDALRESLIGGETVILGCSALRNKYREILRSADPYYKLGSYVSAVKFVLLDVGAEVLADRLNKRAAEGKHFMPATLLQSQLDLLHIDDFEGIYKVDATQSPEAIVNALKSFDFMTKSA
ncbi:gluconokinase [Mercurialis annua]|uniref:gluconokinase n=1 Tax=Mercurialis annua TaxID=3986 RepID=UPI00215E8237|nr:gluconokinase [Mercurialis annua]XP_050206081.1 gluconokinase [Mercurialis annua]XP_050206082.1 gluconokinase [Mercurialis annua]